jgi:hypothetical protein
MLFYTKNLITKIVAQINMYAREKVSNKISQHSIWHDWVDVSEEEMWVFMGLIVSMKPIHLPDMKDYWF